MLSRIALWDCCLFFFSLLAIFRLNGKLGRCCVELLYGTVFFFVFGQKLSAKTALRVQFDTPPTLSQAELQNG